MLIQIDNLTGGLQACEKKAIEDFFNRLEDRIDLPILSKAMLIEHFIKGFEYYQDCGFDTEKIIEILDIKNIGDFYQQGKRQHVSLDNAAIIYPLGMKFGQMPMFRLAVELKQEVEPCLLQLALDFTIKRFPLFASVIKNGFFWHYLETTCNIHLIEEERDIPCKPISITRRTMGSFRVLYYKKRISVEFFHVLTDGIGGMSFLKTLTAEYLRLKQIDIRKQDGILDINGPIDEAELVNEFANAEGKSDMSTFVDKKSLQLDGKLSSLNMNRIMHYVLDTDELKKIAHSYDATITSYLTAIMFMAAKRCIRAKKGIFNIQIPINMRKFNDSRTLRNYAMYFNLTMDIADIGDKESLIIETGRQIKEKGTQEEMNHMMMTTRKIINSLTYLPLFIKVPIVQSVYGYLGNGIIGNTLSNLGLIKVPEEMASHIEKLYFILVPGMPNRATSSMVSFKNKSVFTVTMNDMDLSYLDAVYALLKEDGLDIEMEGSSIYES